MLTILRVGVASIFQIVEAQKYTANSREFPFEFSLAMVWANVETHLAVFTSTSFPLTSISLLTIPGGLALLRPIFRKFIPGLRGNTTYPNGPSRNASNTNNTYTNSIALRRSRSPRDMVIEGQRAFSYPDYDAISLPGATKDGNSISRQEFMQQRSEESMTGTDESPGRGSLNYV